MTTSSQAAGMTKLSVAMNGKNVSMASNMNKGGAKMASGKGTITIDLAKSTLTYTIATTGLKDITEAHIHAGAMGVDGADVLAIDVMTINAKKSTVITVKDAKLLADMAKNPMKYYVNIHTKTFADGAIRGQL